MGLLQAYAGQTACVDLAQTVSTQPRDVQVLYFWIF